MPHQTRRSFLTGAAALGATPLLKAMPIASSMIDPILLQPASDLSQSIHAKQISCRQVMQTYLDHIEHTNPQVNAIISIQPRDLLLQQADERDSQLARGESMGWMHGFPHAVKDLTETKGIRTSYGSPVRDTIPRADAPLVANIRASGAILIGKTNVPELGMGSQTYNSIFGATGNAWNPALTSGGSSGGAACSLALRMLPVADGTDMMGSLRNPGAFNNVFGFRPAVARMGAISTTGPMARNIPDLASLHAVMTGAAPFDPASLARDFKGTRIGWLGTLGLPFKPGIVELCKAALPHFETLGCSVESTALGFSFDTLWKSWVIIRQVLQAGPLKAFYNDPAKRKLFKPEALWEIENGLAATSEQFRQANANRAAFYDAMDKLFTRFDYLILPTAQVFPFAKTTHWPAEIAGVKMQTYHQWMSIVVPGSMLGAPIADVPVGFNSAGLPMGMQIIGRNRDGLGVLQLANAYDNLTHWTKRLPPWLQ